MTHPEQAVLNPCSLVKIRLQTQTTDATVRQVLRSMMKEEGLRAFMKGHDQCCVFARAHGV